MRQYIVVCKHRYNDEYISVPWQPAQEAESISEVLKQLAERQEFDAWEQQKECPLVSLTILLPRGCEADSRAVGQLLAALTPKTPAIRKMAENVGQEIKEI